MNRRSDVKHHLRRQAIPTLVACVAQEQLLLAITLAANLALVVFVIANVHRRSVRAVPCDNSNVNVGILPPNGSLMDD
jgi:hypothetical protein